MFGFGKNKPTKKVWQIKTDEDLVTKVFGKPVTDPIEELKLQDIENEDQLKKYSTVFDYMKQQETFPITEVAGPKAEWEPLVEDEKQWLSKQCILRYLRATSWDTKNAIDRLVKTIGWRREFGIAGGKYTKVTSDLVKEENETGKQQVFGYDTHHRPCLILMTGRQNTPSSDRQIQHLIFMLERSIDFMPKGQDKLCLCAEFKKYPEASPYESMIPPLGVGKEVLRILQYHYPERLGRAMFINMPTLANIFLKLCWPFVDPYTKQKCKFNEPFNGYVDPKMLAYNFGGEVNFEYDHEEYWDDFVKHSQSKQDIMKSNYEKLGGGIGLSELDLREGL